MEALLVWQKIKEGSPEEEIDKTNYIVTEKENINMKHLNKIVLVGSAVIAVGAVSVSALAVSDYKTPAEIVAGLTGKSVESVITEKTKTGGTYGTLADEYGVLEQFESQVLEQKKAYLDERVAAGTMTQEQADAIAAAIESHQANCDGAGTGGIGAGMGAGFGRMNGNRSFSGNGAGCGAGFGHGYGVNTSN